MAECKLQFVRAVDDRYLLRCPNCGVEVRAKYRDPAKYHRQCGRAIPPRTGAQLTADETAALESASGGKLLGDWIAELTKAIGVLPCGGCNRRRAWLNKAHAWLLGRRLD